MVNPGTGSAELPDITLYSPRGGLAALAPPEFELRGAYGDSSFSVEYSFGHSRVVGPRINDRVIEPNVFSLQDIRAHNQPGLGSTVAAHVLGIAREKGFSVGRSGIISTPGLGLMLKMHRLGIVRNPVYLPNPLDAIRPEVPTEAFAASAQRVSAEEAMAQLRAAEAVLERDRAASLALSIQCVFEF